MKTTRVTTIIGTRPELIRLSQIITKLDSIFEHRLVHTGQNSDSKLSTVFFKELKIRKPDLQLEALNSSLGDFLGKLLPSIEREFNDNPPDAVLILGDTNTTLAAIIAKRRGIPVYHLEAGNRSFDQNVPEEINRRIVDHFADFNLAYTSNAKENLLREGIHPRSIAVIGSPLCEVISFFQSDISSSNILNSLEIDSGKYFLVSAHRQENVDSPERLGELIVSLNGLALEYKLPIIISTHPRIKNKIDLSKLKTEPQLFFHDPFGFLDYCKLQKEARVVFSDSGSLAEESVIIGFKGVIIRDSMERHEALESGSVIMSGIKKQGLLDAIKIIESMSSSKFPPPEYLFTDTSTRVVNFISSTINQHDFWNGLRKNKTIQEI